jgi:TonB family protein
MEEFQTMQKRTNRASAAFAAALLAAIVGCALAAPANAQTTYDGPAAYPTCPSPDSPARLKNAYQPAWSELASVQPAGQSTTTVLVIVDAYGNVVDDSVWRSSGNLAFDNEVLRAIKMSSFFPETHNCLGYRGTYLLDVTGGPAQLEYGSIGLPPLPTFEPIIVRASCQTPDSPARITLAYPPEWPEVAIDQGVQPSLVTVAVTLDPNGNLVDKSIVRSSGNDALGQRGAACGAALELRARGAPLRAARGPVPDGRRLRIAQS